MTPAENAASSLLPTVSGLRQETRERPLSSPLSHKPASGEYFARDAHGKPILPLDRPETLYAFGLLIRETEQTLLRLFSDGLLSGTTHTCIGQELCQMAVVRALDDPEDVVLSNHRNHGHFLTYSGDFGGLLAEIMGRQAGVAGGIGGSQHVAFRRFHSNGVQGGMTAIGVGKALAGRLRGETGIVTVIIGDGTLGQGLLYESLNLAEVWKAPVLFVVENNSIAQTTPTSLTTGGSIDGRAAAFGLPHWRLNDADPDFLAKADEVVRRVRAERQPGILTLDTMRMGPHSKGDDLRDPAEIAAIQLRDPLRRLGRQLAPDIREEAEAAAREHIRQTCDRAIASPPATDALARRSIFFNAPTHDTHSARPARPTGANVRSVLNETLRQILRASPDALLLGEDLFDPYGGAFKVTAGLSTEFSSRVISTPISEAGVVGAAIGLALDGFHPIVEIMFADFLTLAFDQIVNHAVKFPGMFADAQIPLVIRTPSGGRRGYGPTHSQSTENLACAVPGLTVIFGSPRHDIGALLWNSVLEWPYPTVFFEHKLLYGATLDPAGYRALPHDPEDPGARLFPTLTRGAADPDITLVTYGGMTSLAEEVAADLARQELDVEIVLPSLLSPLPKRTLLNLLHDRKRIAVLEETHSQSGFGAMLGAALLESGYRGRFAQVGTPPVPIPAARSLEAQILPGEQDVMLAVLNLLGLT
jgi:2-oxoisovalerate dehydrogenase E1 component